ncbi:MAG: tripartite tricarboxylate transporter substrate binding protein [Pseudomonadota bacterium]
MSVYSRRRITGYISGAAISSLLMLVPAQIHAQDAYPSRPVRIIVAIPAGSGTDIIARMIADGLSKRMGRQFIVENRPGAGTIIGNDAVAKAKPDGYTLLINGAAFTIAPAVYSKLPYDAWQDFAPVSVAVVAPNLMAVHPSVPAKTVKELIALARARPDQILYASGGNGTNSHMATALFASMAQIRIVHVPYKGSTPGVIDLIAGNVAMTTNSMPTLMPHVRTGRLRALGVASARRALSAPELPTVAEAAGLPGYESAQWTGVWAPAGTPADIIARLHREIVGTLSTPEVRERLLADGSETLASTPEAFAALIKTELARWVKVVKSAGIAPM